MRRAVVAAVVVALGAGAPGEADAAKPPERQPAKAKKKRRCEVVVFKRRGTLVRRCRRARTALPTPVRLPAPPPAPGLAPASPGDPAPPAPTPPAGGGTTPATQPTPTGPPPPPPPRDPWFLTLHAMDFGNADFRLTPNPGDIPAGTLYLSYKNDDATDHDLWLRSGAQETLVFPPFTGDELQHARLEMTPGAYEFLCRMPGHDRMRVSFRVTP